MWECYCNWVTHSPTDGLLGYLQSRAITNTAAINVLSSPGLSSVLCPLKLGFGQAFPQLFCPSSSCINQIMLYTCCRSGICFGAGFRAQWGFCPSPIGSRLLHERRLWGCRWDFVPISRGSLSLSAHLWNLWVLSGQLPWPHTFW